MKSTRNSAVTFAGAGALAILLASSAFADSGSRYGGQRNGGGQPQTDRPQASGTWQGANGNGNRNDNNDARNNGNDNARSYDNGNSWKNDNRANRDSRDNERVELSGKVSSFSRERDGYRVRLDQDSRSFYVPSAQLRNGGRDLRVGLSIGFGGLFRGGLVNVDAVSWPAVSNRVVYDQGLVYGIVDRVDYRTGTLLLRDRSTGRLIDVSLGATRSGLGLRDLRRGDAVTLTGQWLRGNSFAAYRIDGLNSRR